MHFFLHPDTIKYCEGIGLALPANVVPMAKLPTPAPQMVTTALVAEVLRKLNTKAAQ